MIKSITKADFEPYIADCLKLGLSFSEKTQYYGLYVDGKLVGFTGILWYMTKAVFKNHYVLPEHRNKGYFKQLFRHSMILVRTNGVKVIEANCSQMSPPLYLDMGGIITKNFKDWTQVRIRL